MYASAHVPVTATTPEFVSAGPQVSRLEPVGLQFVPATIEKAIISICVVVS